ncbi:MAG: DUF5995 family protein [Leeuwenhoekiella sp.]
MVAATIDEVIFLLKRIIASEKDKNSSLAYFPVLYLRVTQRIKEGILANEFQDNSRMERLDVVFANRYLKAYEQFERGGQPSQSWLNCFKAKRLMVMQHLLLGINAHINLDLGIAAAEISEDDNNLPDLETDFNAINAILASLVAEVKEKIGRISPLFKLLELVGKGKEDKLVTFSINIARDGAWLFANEYFNAVKKTSVVEPRDQKIAALATKIISPKSKLLQFMAKLVLFFEMKNTDKVVSILENKMAEETFSFSD